MKRNIEPPESSDEESKVALKKAKKEKYGKRKKTASEHSDTDGWNNKVNRGCYRNVEDGTDGSSSDTDEINLSSEFRSVEETINDSNSGTDEICKKIDKINLSSEFRSVEEICNIDSDNGTDGSKKIGESSLSSELDFLVELSDIDTSVTSDGSTYIKRTFCCVKSTLNYVKDFDGGGDRSPCSCPRRQDRNDERNRSDSGAGSSKGMCTNNHSPQPQASVETYTTGPQFESHEAAVGHAFIERGESKDNDHDISGEFHSCEDFVISDLNVAYFETVEDEGEDGDEDGGEGEDGDEDSDDGEDYYDGEDEYEGEDEDDPEEFHSFYSSSEDLNAGNGQIAENGELIGNDDRPDDDEEDIDEMDENDFSDYSISGDDEGYVTAENTDFPDDEGSFSEPSDSSSS